MLTELRVRDLAVISDVTLPLAPGLNVITGETGAGKSILVDALSLLLGERASGDLVRPGAKKAVVEAAFDVGPSGPLAAAADEAGVDVDDGQFVARREIGLEGRNRAWANGSRSTVGVLARLGRILVDLHGQHESQSLLRAGTQRDILDAFAGAGDDRRLVRERFRRLAELAERESQLIQRRDDVRKRADYLRHVVKEIEGVAPVAGEEEELATEAKRLAHAEELTALAERLAGLLDGDDEGAVRGILGDVARTLDQLERIDDGVSAWRELLDAATAGVDELAREARSYAAAIEIDPARLAEVEARRDRIYRLMQKYGGTVSEVLDTGAEAAHELDLLDTADSDLEAIAAERADAARLLDEAAAGLTERRTAAAARLAEAVDALLPPLGMPDGHFIPEVAPLDGPTVTGADAVTFTVRMNPGIDARPLAQVASGGELSRLMLALKVVLAKHDAVATLIFDEVDQGIGGEVGAMVADALAEVARAKQVVVVTHLPQIAARADRHLLVTKGVTRGIASTSVRVLGDEERVREVTRMLGDQGDPVLRRHATELLERRGRAVKGPA